MLKRHRRASRNAGPSEAAGLLSMALGVGLLCACGSAAQTPGDAGVGSPIRSPYDALRAIRASLEGSPDNLPARARALIAAKDPDAIFRFVRDEIAVYPPPELGSTQGSRLFGVRGTLRGGAGTPRDRAELLAWMYREAGFDAEVVAGVGPDSVLTAEAEREIYLRTIQRTFAPVDPPAPLTWGDLVVPDGTETTPYDPDGTASRALADALGQLLTAGAMAAVPSIPRDPVPLVAVQVDGTTRYANPMFPTAAFGEARSVNPVPAGAPEALPEVTIRLSVARSDAPLERTEVVTASVALDALIGRQILARFQSALPTETLIGSRLDDSQIFIPVLMLTGGDVSDDVAARNARSGALVTRSGDVVETKADGSVLYNGVPFDRSALDPSAAGRVDALSMEINAAAFPQIEVAARALDSGGRPVTGLSAKAFALTEDGRDRQVVMRRNGGDLRVLFLLDKTLSQPPQFFDHAQASNLGQGLGRALFTAHPSARAQVAVLDGPAPSGDGFTITSSAALGEAFAAPVAGVDSPIAHAVRAAERAAPSFIVLFTDGIDSTPAWEQRLIPSDVPVLVVGCAADPQQVVQSALDQIAALSGGMTIAAGTLGEPAAVSAAMLALAERAGAAPYRFWYRAPETGPSTRAVSLQVGAKTATGSYQRPASPTPVRALSGIYLTIRIDRTEVTRTLAGWDREAAPSAAVPAETTTAVERFLFGGALLSFEGGPPAVSEWLSDMVEAQLRTEALYTAAAADDKTAFVAALRQTGGFAIPAEVAAAQSDVPRQDGTLIYGTGARVVLYRFSPDDVDTRHLDLLQFTRFRALGAANEADTFRATLRASARLALAERAMFPESTASLLAGKTLMLLRQGFLGAQDLGMFPMADRDRAAEILNRYTGSHRIIAADGSTPAFWAIDIATGTLIGVLPDGSGGGGSSCGGGRNVGEYFKLIELLGKYLAIPEISGWVVLGKFSAIAAVEAALCFTDIGPDPGWTRDPLGAFACGSVSSAFGGYVAKGLPGDGGMFSKIPIDHVKGFVGGKIAGGLGGCPPIVPKGC
ncbi:MAG: hypothetical protein IT384_24090 [Deltaproteobacteria bacterium]|nr:hypothetical protein [Deltaproteobacteria bacterium]